MKRFTHYLQIFSTTILLISAMGCQQKQKDNDPNFKPTPSYSLPAPKHLDKNLSQVIQFGCNDWYNTFLQNSRFNGGVLVAKNGNIVFEKYNGIAHIGSNDTIKANTPFHIASVSKTFTAMAVLKLCQDKKINLDDEFSKYFPEFNYPGVTIRSLLSHRSGLPNYVYFMDEMGWDKNTFVSNQNILNVLIHQKFRLRDISSPNTHFTYCNTNYALLALWIEKISGNSYPEHLRKTIFEPVGMHDSFVYSDKDSAKTTPSYDWRNYQAAFINLDKVYGDKNIFSTPRDLLKWDQLLRSGLYLNDTMLREAYKPYSNERPGIRNYGLGWRMNNYPDGSQLIYHNGWWHGNNAAFVRMIKENATIIVLGNKFNSNIYKAKYLTTIFNNSMVQGMEDESEGK